MTDGQLKELIRIFSWQKVYLNTAVVFKLLLILNQDHETLYV